MPTVHQWVCPMLSSGWNLMCFLVAGGGIAGGLGTWWGAEGPHH